MEMQSNGKKGRHKSINIMIGLFLFIYSIVELVSLRMELIHSKPGENLKPCFELVQDWSKKTVILHTNDVHGRIFQGQNGSLGIHTVLNLKKRLQQMGAKVILLDAGDTLVGPAKVKESQGAIITGLMNYLGYDAMVCGNHDFEYGTKQLLDMADQLNFPMLGANVIDRRTNRQLLKSHVLIQKNGVTYGIFGLVTEATMLLNEEENVQDIIMIDPVLSAKMEVSCLKAAGADIIIALTHLGMVAKDEASALDVISEVDGIDLVIDGHSHSGLEECRQANPKPSVVYTSTGRYLNQIGMIIIDEDKHIEAYSLSKEQLMDWMEYLQQLR